MLDSWESPASGIQCVSFFIISHVFFIDIEKEGKKSSGSWKSFGYEYHTSEVMLCGVWTESVQQK